MSTMSDYESQLAYLKRLGVEDAEAWAKVGVWNAPGGNWNSHAAKHAEPEILPNRSRFASFIDRLLGRPQ